MSSFNSNGFSKIILQMRLIWAWNVSVESSFNVDLGVIGIAVEVDVMLPDDLSKWKQVD